jgi:predicted NUDIX family NTP pyrophosphohydrolase
MAVSSAGILLYRLVEEDAGLAPEVLIAHMGGPYWAARDEGAWSIPKGEYEPDSESALDAAQREFGEELGVPAPEGPYGELGTFPYSSGKRVTVFVADGAGLSLDDLVFGEFELEWPPRSGRRQSFPEVDRAEWFRLAEAEERINPAQAAFLERLRTRFGS